MQTFLPFPDFSASAKVLDQKRLGKQRVEAYQLLKALTIPSYGWKQHPAARMWLGHVPALVNYTIAICDEWTSRGYRDTCRSKVIAHASEHNIQTQGPVPSWLGDFDVHASHRSNLIRKNKEWYKQFGWTEPDNLPYVWPRNETLEADITRLMFYGCLPGEF